MKLKLDPFSKRTDVFSGNSGSINGELMLGAIYLIGSVVTGGIAAIAGIAFGSWI